jgi:hypothetical protein
VGFKNEKTVVLEEMVRIKMPFKSWTYEEWNNILVEKYQGLYNLVMETIPELWAPLEFAISLQKILNIKNCTLPFAGILLGAPSSLKTRIVELFADSKNSYYTDNFSARALVSHYAGMNEEQLKKIDMLPRIKNKIFLCSELSPMFTKKEEDLKEIIGLITRVLDGQGLVTDSGTCGQRNYKGEYMFTWLGAAVDIPYRVHKLMGTIGPKLYFLRLSKIKKTEDMLLEAMDKDDFIPKYNKIKETLMDYLGWFDRCPISVDGKEIVTKMGNLIKIQWENDKDEEYARRVIIKMAVLLGHLRSVVTTWTQDGEGNEYSHSTTTLEEPQRAITQLRNLARGHALSQGRTFITIQDLPMVVKVVLSTASLDRVNIFDLLIANGGTLSTSLIKKSLNTDHKVAHRIMTELEAVGLVYFKENVHQTDEKMIVLNNEFGWFLEEQFIELRQGFRPTDNSEFIKEYCRKYKISLGENLLPCNTAAENEKPVENYSYNCYECAKINHGTPVFQTNSLTDYQRHWISSGHNGSCMPGVADIEIHGWVRQGRSWEI